MNERTAAEIFEKRMAAKAGTVERCGTGHGNYVYIISGEKGKYVIRCSGEKDAYKNTLYWLKRLKKVDIPVPNVLASGEYREYSYIILSYLEGADLGTVYTALSGEEKRMIAREVVRIQRAVSAMEVPDIDADWTWTSFIRYMLTRARERIAKNGYFDTARVEQLRTMAGTLQGYFDRIRPIAYLDDISTKNLLVEKGCVSGIIDVDWIGTGDRLTYAALSNVALLDLGYDTDYVDYLLEEMKVNAVEKKAFIYYSLLYCVDFMGERGMWFGDKRIAVNEAIVSRLNGIYDHLMAEWDALHL